MTIKNRNDLWMPLALVAGLALAGCGGGGGGGGDETGASADVTTSSYDVELPDGVTTASVDGDFDGSMLFAGQDATAAVVFGVSIPRSVTGIVTGATLSSRDLAGFVAERPAPLDEFGSPVTDAATAVDALGDEVLDAIGVASPITSLVTTDFQEISRQRAAGGSIDLGSFELTTSSNANPTDVASDLVALWGLNQENGSVSNFPSPASDESEATTFSVQIGLFYASANSIYLAVTVVPSDLAGTYQSLAGVTTDPNNAVPSGSTRSSKTDEFTASGGGGVADFLFVVDNSGSMSNEQTNLANAASAFSSVLSTSGLDFQLGVITTDSSALVGGGFTGDTATFESNVNGLGTGGSIQESGIFHGEEALESGGSVPNAGFPRQGAQMSVVMISDESDQYTSYSGGAAFDQSSNVFRSEGYIVHAIVETDPADFQYGEEYIELANNTGGSRAPIASRDGSDLTEADFTQIMTAIAQKAGGASSIFQLTETPLPATISVTDEGTSVPRDSSNGWSYNSAANSIVFNGSALPDANDGIRVTYDFVSN